MAASVEDWLSETHLGLQGLVWVIIGAVFLLILGTGTIVVTLHWRRQHQRKLSTMHLALETPAEMEFWVQVDRHDGEEWGMLTEVCPQGLRITGIEPNGLLDRWNRAHKGLGWKVNESYDVNVRQHDNPNAKIVGKRRAGSIVFGICHLEYVELRHGHGYIAKNSRKGTLLERASDISIMVGDVIVEIDGLFGAHDIQKEMYRRKVERFLVRRIPGVSDAVVPSKLPVKTSPDEEPKVPEALIEATIVEQVFAISDTNASAMPLDNGAKSRWRSAAVPAHQMDSVREACRTAFDEPGADEGLATAVKPSEGDVANIAAAPAPRVIDASAPRPRSILGFGACCSPPAGGGQFETLDPDAP